MSERPASDSEVTGLPGPGPGEPGDSADDPGLGRVTGRRRRGTDRRTCDCLRVGSVTARAARLAGARAAAASHCGARRRRAPGSIERLSLGCLYYQVRG
eukprot:746179-Hanusia_phi.AAC.5